MWVSPEPLGIGYGYLKKPVINVAELTAISAMTLLAFLKHNAKIIRPLKQRGSGSE
jgi:hypothetical protein